MRRRTNFTPTESTILVSLALILVGLIGTYGNIVPVAIGLLAFVAATVVLLLGMVFRGI